jgi:16S rRNA (uracil1498-N3)-methyltransferase
MQSSDWSLHLTNREKQNGYLILEHLSKVELYYTPAELISDNEIILVEDEFKHSVKVMRSSAGDDLFVTNGEGSIFKSKILSVNKKKLTAKINNQYKYKNESENIIFCIPKLKNPDRLKFAIEKSVELGITNFRIFESKNTISKTSNLKRLQKIALSAMKQSLRSFLPELEFDTFDGLFRNDHEKFVFDQNAREEFTGGMEFSKPAFFIFGPEGGLDQSELNKAGQTRIYKLTDNRLRTETAIVKCAAVLNF